MYCDGGLFTGNSENKEAQLFFRGQQIWLAAMEEFMSLGMHNVKQALLTGCSAGGLASILHCDEFRSMFPLTTKVKCLSDAGMFLDAIDVSGGRSLRNIYNSAVNLHGLQDRLSRTCTQHLDPTSCFFPQNLIANIKTPLFLLNSAYDYWQIADSLAPPHADPNGHWKECITNLPLCNATQIKFLDGFRNQMIDDIKTFSQSNLNIAKLGSRNYGLRIMVLNLITRVLLSLSETGILIELVSKLLTVRTPVTKPATTILYSATKYILFHLFFRDDNAHVCFSYNDVWE